jgi:hypothetical protein
MATKKTRTQEEMAPGVSSHTATTDDSTEKDKKVVAGATPKAELTPSAEVQASMRSIKKVQKQREAREEAIAELLTPDPDAVDDVTASSEPKAEDINPGFTIMDIAGIKDWFAKHVQWLRDRGATVNGPVVAMVEVKDRSGAAATREAAAPGPMTERQDTLTVFEATFKWQYPDIAEGGKRPASPKEDDSPQDAGRKMEELAEWQARQAPQLIVQRVALTELDAWRDMAQEVLARRYDV